MLRLKLIDISKKASKMKYNNAFHAESEYTHLPLKYISI